MNKDFLKQYVDLQAEIKELEKRIDNLSKFKYEYDKVRGSSNEFPYTEKSFFIEGYNIQDIDRLNKIRDILTDRMTKCEEMKVEIERFISSIPSSLTRRVFQYRYINGWSWQRIAFKIGKHDESYPRKMVHDKYLEGLKCKE